MSKTDIVERLLEPDFHDPECPFNKHCYCDDGAPHDRIMHPLAQEAADTITRLRKERDEARADTIEKCLVAVRGSELLENLDNPEDRGYMGGIREACEAIRALTPDKEE